MSLGHGASIVRDGLVLHLDAANVKSYPGSGTTWYDLGINKTNFSLHNGASYDSVEKSMVFDGVDDNAGIDTPDSLQLKNNKTMSFAWKHYSSGGDVGATLIRVGLGVDLLYALFSDRAQRRITFHWYNSGFFSVYSTSNIFDINTWNICNCVIEGSTCSFYLNGNFVSSSSVTTPSPASAAKIGIGASRSGTSIGTTAQDFCGEISVGQVYNRALSVQEVKQNFEALRGRYGI